jgi:hypothetical protein
MKLVLKVESPEKKVWDAKYPKFAPAKYITIKKSGYLNGGGYVQFGMIMKLVRTDGDFDGGYDYQGFINQDMARHGNTNVEEIGIRHKAIANTGQYTRIEGDWFRESTDTEIADFERWLSDIRSANGISKP